MNKPSASSAASPRLCPTCGTRVGAAATKCLVCGADLTLGATVPTPAAKHGGFNWQQPLLYGGLVLLLIGGVLLTLYALGSLQAPEILQTPTPTTTATPTVPPTFTYTPTSTETPAPTATPLPPLEYKVVAGDTCSKIAAKFNVSVQSIILLNGLDPNCVLSVGVTLKIPQPTPTPTPLPTATIGSIVVEPTRQTYTVHAGDTLQGIAKFYGVTLKDLMDINGITDPNNIREGQVLILPPTGPTATPSPYPAWAAPNLLQPADGQVVSASDGTVALQWSGVGELRGNEYYYVAIEDVTCECAAFYRQATIETKLIVPASFLPSDGSTHAYRWNVTTVRQKPSTSAQPEYDSAGATSANRVFVWVGGAPTATPSP